MVKSRSLGRRAVVAVRGKPRERAYCTSSRTFYVYVHVSLHFSFIYCVSHSKTPFEPQSNVAVRSEDEEDEMELSDF